MFDICKNNQRVAHLNLTKTAYRLGEAVMGVLDFEHAIIPTYEVRERIIWFGNSYANLPLQRYQYY